MKMIRGIPGSPLGWRNWKIAGGAIALALAIALAGLNMFNPRSILDGIAGGKAASALGFGEGMGSRFGGAGANMLAMLGLRSPGERSKGELADTKGHRSRVAQTSMPHQRALAKVRPRNGTINQPFLSALGVGESIPAPVNALSVPPIGGLGAVNSLLPGNLLPVGGGPIFGGGPIGSSPIFGGGGGGIIGSIPSPIVPAIVPPISSAVPEPSTWALMMVGFGGMGFSLRRARRRDRQVKRAGEATVEAR